MNDENITKQEILDAIKEAVKQECNGAFQLDPEKHYKSHERLDKFLDMLDDTGCIARRIIITAVVGFIVMAVAFGTVFKFGQALKIMGWWKGFQQN